MSDYHCLSRAFVAARKEHRCIWCGEKIAPGETYEREKSIYDGAFQNHAWHEECAADAKTYFGNGSDEFTPYENERPAKEPA